MRKVQLVFPQHEKGTVRAGTIVPPPLGLLTLGTYLKSKVPTNIEIYDGNTDGIEDIFPKLDGDIVGISCWFSNYENGIRIAEQVKAQRADALVIVGGPHTFGLAERIVRNNECIDVVVCGDAEEALSKIIQGESYENIPGLSYRKGDVIKTNPQGQGISLNEIPFFDLSMLQTPYEWVGARTTQTAMAVSGVRGCSRIERCKYCAIPTMGVRTQQPDRFWKQLDILHKAYGIDYFFETGDIFPIHFARQLAEVRERPEVRLRIYSYPGLITQENVEVLAKIGVDNVFIGIESTLIWDRKRKDPRKYATRYSMNSIHDEIELLEKYRITVFPSFILGLPGETEESLEENMNLIRAIAYHQNVSEIVVNQPVPFPGTAYFKECIANEKIRKRYSEVSGQDLYSEDKLKYDILSHAFVEQQTHVRYEEIKRKIKDISEMYQSTAHFLSTENNK